MKSWRTIALAVVTLACLLEAYGLVWQHDRLLYFRSKMEENRLLADLRELFPAGAAEEDVLGLLGPEARPALVRNGAEALLSVRLPLPVPARSYPGFDFRFRDRRLVAIVPIGPDGPGRDLPMTSALRAKLDR